MRDDSSDHDSGGATHEPNDAPAYVSALEMRGLSGLRPGSAVSDSAPKAPRQALVMTQPELNLWTAVFLACVIDRRMIALEAAEFAKMAVSAMSAMTKKDAL